jgi:hypothetical protein
MLLSFQFWIGNKQTMENTFLLEQNPVALPVVSELPSAFSISLSLSFPPGGGSSGRREFGGGKYNGGNGGVNTGIVSSTLSTITGSFVIRQVCAGLPICIGLWPSLSKSQ